MISSNSKGKQHPTSHPHLHPQQPHPNSNPNLSLHLTDPSLTPLLRTSSTLPPPTPAQLPSLTTLTTTALSAYTSALHLNLGHPQRIIIESHDSGPILLHSFIATPSTSPRKSKPVRSTHSQSHPQVYSQSYTTPQSHIHSADRLHNLATPTGLSHTRSMEILSAAREEMRPLSGTTEGSHTEQEHEDERGEGIKAPLLVGTVVARSAGQIGEARRAAHRIEMVATGLQRELIKSMEGKIEGENEGMAGEG